MMFCFVLQIISWNISFKPFFFCQSYIIEWSYRASQVAINMRVDPRMVIVVLNKQITPNHPSPYLQSQPPQRVHPHTAEYCGYKENMHYTQWWQWFQPVNTVTLNMVLLGHPPVEVPVNDRLCEVVQVLHALGHIDGNDELGLQVNKPVHWHIIKAAAT